MKEPNARRGRDVSLECYGERRLEYVKGYSREDGVHVQGHFRHETESSEDACFYASKYGTRGGGESKEHKAAKIHVREAQCLFRYCSSKRDCKVVVSEIPILPEWTSKEEVCLAVQPGVQQKRRFVPDVVFYDKHGEIALVVEIWHTNGTTDEKRDWMRDQPFEYVEVRSEEPNRVVDGDGDVPMCAGCMAADVANDAVAAADAAADAAHGAVHGAVAAVAAVAVTAAAAVDLALAADTAAAAG